MALKPPPVSPQRVSTWQSPAYLQHTPTLFTTLSERQPLLRQISGSLELDKVKHTLSLFLLFIANISTQQTYRFQ